MRQSNLEPFFTLYKYNFKIHKTLNCSRIASNNDKIKAFLFITKFFFMDFKRTNYINDIKRYFVSNLIL